MHDGPALRSAPAERAAARAALAVADDAFAVAVLGRISPWKGQEVLVRALAEPAPADRGRSPRTAR